MAGTTLAAAEFAIGEKLLAALDAAGLPVSVALWLFLDEYEDWRFVLASKELDKTGGAKAYGLVHDALASQGMSLEQTPTLLILEMSDPTIRELRKIFGKAASVEGMRIGNQMLGRRFVEDGLVYRIR